MNRVLILILLCGMFCVDTLNATFPMEECRIEQCHSVTNSGTRCKRRARPNSRYCKQHSSSVVPKKEIRRCRFMADEGTQCTAETKPNSRYCLQHQ